MATGPTVQKAIGFFEKATEEDQNLNYGEALRFYEHGVEYLLQAMECEAEGNEAKDFIRTKCVSYLDRTEKLKALLKESEKKSVKHEIRNTDSSVSATDLELQSKLNRAIVVGKTQIDFSDVAGLEEPKKILKGRVIWPVEFPRLFTGSSTYWKGILLFGPPGTGKTYLAKAVPTESNSSTFFSLSSSDLVSKWLGESEQLVKNLFELARTHKPSIIFVDDVDLLCSSRLENENESIRRIRTEFLAQMHDLCSDNGEISVLAATNIPWTLDAAIRQCFKQRIYIPLPDERARLAMFKRLMGNSFHCLTEENIRALASRTEGYSGADITVLIRDALMQPVRRVQSSTHFKRTTGPSPEDKETICDDLLVACSPGDPSAIEMNWMELVVDKLIIPPATMDDMCHTLGSIKPTVNEDELQKFDKFIQDYGEEG